MTSSADPIETSHVADVAGFSGARLARIANFFNVEVARGAMAGAVLLIERRGETVFKRAFGYRNRQTGTAMSLDTIFRIYSMTKPMVSVATMMLVAEGRLTLDQPVGDFIPAFNDLKVLREGAHVTPQRLPTIHDLLRHTAGLSYERNGGPLAPLYRDAHLFSRDTTNETFVARLGALPLAHEPGTVFEYSHATDVLGRVVEVAAGRSLGAILRQRLIDPLGMGDTAFHVPDPNDHARIAEPLPGEVLEGGTPLFDPRMARSFESGGMGLVSTLDDYARFARMLLAEGQDGRHVYLSPPMMAYMTADHIGPETGILKGPGFLPGPGYGFGLGFSRRLEAGASPYPGSAGEFGWSGIAGTYFWIDPSEDLLVILLAQAPRHRLRHRAALRALVYDALVGKSGLKAEARRRKTED